MVGGAVGGKEKSRSVRAQWSDGGKEGGYELVQRSSADGGGPIDGRVRRPDQLLVAWNAI